MLFLFPFGLCCDLVAYSKDHLLRVVPSNRVILVGTDVLIRMEHGQQTELVGLVVKGPSLVLGKDRGGVDAAILLRFHFYNSQTVIENAERHRQGS